MPGEREPTISIERKTEFARVLLAIAHQLRQGQWLCIPDDLEHIADRILAFQEWQYTHSTQPEPPDGQ